MHALKHTYCILPIVCDNIAYRNQFYRRTSYFNFNFLLFDYAWACVVWSMCVYTVLFVQFCLQFDAHMIFGWKGEKREEEKRILNIQFSLDALACENKTIQHTKTKCKRKNKLPTTWNSLLLSAKIVIYNQSKVSLAHIHTRTHFRCYWIVLSMFHTILTSSTIFANHFTTSPFHISCLCRCRCYSLPIHF